MRHRRMAVVVVTHVIPLIPRGSSFLLGCSAGGGVGELLGGSLGSGSQGSSEQLFVGDGSCLGGCCCDCCCGSCEALSIEGLHAVDFGSCPGGAGVSSSTDAHVERVVKWSVCCNRRRSATCTKTSCSSCCASSRRRAAWARVAAASLACSWAHLVLCSAGTGGGSGVLAGVISGVAGIWRAAASDRYCWTRKVAAAG